MSETEEGEALASLSRFGIYSGEKLLAKPKRDIKFLLDPYVPAGGVVLLYGRWGSHKTPISFSMTAAIAAGIDWCGVKGPGRPIPSLYIEIDSPDVACEDRFKEILSSSPLPHPDVALMYPGFDLITRMDPEDQALIGGLAEAHRVRKYGFVCIDSLRCAHSMDSISDRTPHQVYRAAARLFDGATIMFVHHARKTRAEETEETREEGASGSNAWIDRATVILKVAYANQRAHTVRLTHVKSQQGPTIPPLTLKMEGSTPGLPKVSLESLQLVLENLPPGLPKGEVDSHVAEVLGISPRHARRLRGELK